MNNEDKNFAWWLRKLRLQHDYSQEYLGSVLDMSYSSYGKYESGKSRLHLSQAKILADLYGMSLDSFFGMGENVEQTENDQASEPIVPMMKPSKVSILVELDGNLYKLNQAIKMLTNMNSAITASLE